MLRDNQLQAKTTRLILLLLLFFAGTMTLASLVGPLRADWVLADRNLELSGTTFIYLLYGLTGLGYFALLPIFGVAFLLWLHRAYANLHQLAGEHPRYATAWVVGAWFVPLLNLVLPYNIMREMWCSYQRVAFGRVIAPAALIGWWWAAVLGSLAVALVAGWQGSAFHNQPLTRDAPGATLVDAGARLLAMGLTWYIIGRCAWFEEQVIARQLLDRLGQAAPEVSPSLRIKQSDYWQPEDY